MRLQATFYRGHDPQWAFSPLAGDGAKIIGGRFNPIGVPALYLGATIETVIAELTHGFSYRLQPLTVVSYEVDVDDVIDLRTITDHHAAGVALADMTCDWRYEFAEGREPASWRIANRLRETAAGILVPSFANCARADMYNLVLWRWSDALPHRVTVYDPIRRLPKDRRSWE